MRIFVMRHAFAGDYFGKKEDRLEADQKRPLMQDGIDAVDSLIQWMSDNDAIPNTITASTLTRAVQTAQRIGKAFGIRVVTDQNLEPSKPMEMIVKKYAADPIYKRPLIVAHSDNINPGLRRLNGIDVLDAGYDPIAMAELRILKVDRNDGSWKERRRVMPSDIGQTDYY